MSSICIVDVGVACFVCFVFFFFKQKTAYEMRISDWSSDVCSSDLVGAVAGAVAAGHERQFELAAAVFGKGQAHQAAAMGDHEIDGVGRDEQIGRASCRERVCQYV